MREVDSKFTCSDSLSEWTTNYLVNSSDTDNISTVNLQLTSVEVKATTKKLKVSWTPTMIQDLQYYEAMNPNVELTAIYEQQERARIKKQRYKDRKIYIRMIEEWAGVEVNKKVPLKNE